MVNAQKRRQLLELQHFILRPKSADARIDVYSQMITRCLIEHGKKELNLPYDAILYHIKKDHLFEELPNTLIDTALEQLQKNDDVTIDGQFITLSQNKIDEIDSNINEMEELRKTVLQELQDKICEKLPELGKEKISTILEKFEEYLSTTFQRYGLVLAKILMDPNKNNRLTKGLGNPENYLDAMMQMIPEKKRGGIDKVLNDFFYNPSENVSKYLYGLAQSYIVIQVLNINPDLKKIQDVAWNKKIIYLDTNVLLPLLLEGDEKHSSIRPLIENTVALGATVLVSETTIKEFTNKLQSFQKSHSTAVIERKLSFAQEIDHDDEMLRSYLLERKHYTGLSIENFCLKYENYEILLEKGDCKPITPN